MTSRTSSTKTRDRPNPQLDNLSTKEEVRKAVKLLSCGKAPGPDAIPAEVYKAGGPVMIQKLTHRFQCIWREGKVPQQSKDASIVHIYKRKGNCQSCNNHKGISHLCIAGKTLARVLLNRLLQTKTPPRKPVRLPRRSWDI
ncbi:hypothetical protein RRG08_063678 [Elysia crispata]|uniref:Uncharacterized protein n=1 Tax=Elysia crispata TaxID=231223 RepID=A0AAE0ZBJ2_9GAST|nr:hypothetical protein RRG08_063678 [Elysia crispata]